jgi:serine/threonine protein phosphatase 1
MKSLGLGKPAPARVPDNMRVYAVGDIHGCSRVLDLLHQRIEADCKNYSGDRHIVYLGDFTDRGPDSKGVLERLLHGVPGGLSPHYIRGNHDQAVLDFLEDPESYRVWRGFGGAETLWSYGVRPPLYDQAEQIAAARDDFAKALPFEHLAFLRNLELKISIGDYAFVHAGIRPGVSLDRQSEQDLLWIREEFLFSTARHEKVVVHGHTPLPAPVRTSNRISIDTGAYATGVLTACVLEDTACRFLQAKAG